MNVQILEHVIRDLTTEINGQFPRPWMTSMQNPSQAEVFIVGYNPANAYPAARIEHKRHINALFNRNGETCQGLYAELNGKSPTRGKIQMLSKKLAVSGVTSVLETNVVCYATPSKKDLSAPEHAGGKKRGLEIFRALVREIVPKAMIIHGVGVRNEFNAAFESDPPLPRPSEIPDIFPNIQLSNGTHVFVIPSLALPGFQNWPPGIDKSFCHWADRYLDELAVRVARVCAT